MAPTLQPVLSRFLLCFAEALATSGTPVGNAHAERLLGLEAGLAEDGVEQSPPARIPVQAACEAGLAEDAPASPLARSLLDLMPFLHLTRNRSYAARPPSPDFAERYGYGVICGPAGGPPALLRDPHISFGLLMLGPHTHYPLHHHPADELYYVASGPSLWWAGIGPWLEKQRGEAIHHPAWIPHATVAGARPLTALYVWQGDLDTDAVFLSHYAEGAGEEAPGGAR